jgi:DNA-binding transcriptional ArsR family regulator
MQRSGIEELKNWELVFSALAHENRRQILTILLSRGGSMTAGEIANRFRCKWPTTTRHLGVLEEAGLIVVEKKGRERIYKLAQDHLIHTTQSWLKYFKPKGEKNE